MTIDRISSFLRRMARQLRTRATVCCCDQPPCVLVDLTLKRMEFPLPQVVDSWRPQRLVSYS